MMGAVGFLLSVLVLLIAAPAEAKRIVVNTTNDEFASGKDCSLREAIQSAQTNTNFGACTRKGKGREDPVILEGGEVYGRSLGTLGEDLNASGDLDIIGKVVIRVQGEGPAVIDVNEVDRVVQVHPGASLDARRVRFDDGNVAGNGGGILNRGRTTLRRASVRSSNATGAGGDGGGIASFQGRLDVRNSDVTGNDAAQTGGGLYLVGGKTSISRSSVNSNDSLGSEGGGGMMISTDNPVTLTNVTVSGNRANSRGGGINVFDGGGTKLNAVTITDNTADMDGNSGGTNAGRGGGVNLIGEPISVINSIIAGNFATDPAGRDCGGVSAVPGRNLVGDGTGCSEGPPAILTADPMLDPLSEYGGVTQSHRLQPGSPAIGKARRKTAPSRDQRGRKRDDRPDLGSFER